MEFNNMNEVNAFEEVLNSCTGSVWMESAIDGRRYDMSESNARLVALGKIYSGNGSDLEIYADTRSDETRIMNYMVEHMAA